jgi:hypothetical protein
MHNNNSRLLKALEFPSTTLNDDIIALMQDVLVETGIYNNRSKGAITPFEKTISVFANRLYLKALLETEKYDDYFGVSMTLVAVQIY